MNRQSVLKLYTVFIAILFAVVFPVKNSNCQEDSLKDSEKYTDLLKLTAVGNGYSDQTIVVFIPGSTPGFDPQYDAYKLPGSNAAPQLYSIIPGSNLAINALPEILINLVVQLGFKVGANTTYSITATETNSFSPSVSIFLHDTKESMLIDLKTNPSYTFTATTIDNIERFKLYFRYPVRLDLNVMLEGSFNGTEMTTMLNQNGHIPLSQPYNTAPWNYDGNESVPFIPNPDVVDWVLVELRDATDAGNANSLTVVERKSGFLLKNGSIVDIDGIGLLSFTQTIHENIFIAIWHRNHLGIISSSSPVETAGTFFYDFTIQDTQAYGGILAQKELASGIFAMIGGDADAGGSINEADLTTNWMTQAGLSGYLQSDVNLDGQSDNPDKNDLWLYNIGASSQIPE
jgi:hypothetical protein